jgi:hypothetical protein
VEVTINHRPEKLPAFARHATGMARQGEYFPAQNAVFRDAKDDQSGCGIVTTLAATSRGCTVRAKSHHILPGNSAIVRNWNFLRLF